MSRRPRIPDDLMELFESKKDHRNQSIADVLFTEYPELKKELKEKKKQEEDLELETDLEFDKGLFD